jgi:hypothetical protein
MLYLGKPGLGADASNICTYALDLTANAGTQQLNDSTSELQPKSTFPQMVKQ